MYPSIGDLFADLLGADIGLLHVVKTFGFFVAAAFLLGGYTMAREFQRKEQDGLLQPTIKKVLVGKPATLQQLIISGLIGFAFGYKLLHIAFHWDTFTDSPHEIIFSIDGSWIGAIVGAALLAFLKYREKKKEQLKEPEWREETIRPHHHVGNITLIAAIFGILGAKLFHLLENPDEFAHLLDSAEGFFSGLTMYGGLICAAIAVVWYAKSKGLTVFHTIDSSAPGLMLAYGIGRIGCQLSGDGDWGIDNTAPKPGWLEWLPDWMWGFTYPHNVISTCRTELTADFHGPCPRIPDCDGSYCVELLNPVFPTPFYEAVICIALFALMWTFRKKIVVPGVMFAIYLIMNGIERFFIEKIRINEKIFGVNITQAEIIAVLLILIGLFGLYYLPRNKDKIANV